jgi:phosphonate transport system substrate-binding protein
VSRKLKTLRLALPPSYAKLEPARKAWLEQFLGFATSLPVEVTAAPSYDALAASLLSGETSIAWAPPFTCARLENAGIPILVRAIRGGRSSYRGALVCRAGASLNLEYLQGLRAAWVDRESTGGYLLVAAFLKARGLDLDRTFASQQFLGSYQAALNAVIAGQADVASFYAPPADAGSTLNVEELLPGKGEALRALAFTQSESPNDGVALAPFTPPLLVRALEQAFIGVDELPMGPELLELFHADRFELAPRNGYRALYQSLRTLR